jgi:hypothetical protein
LRLPGAKSVAGCDRLKQPYYQPDGKCQRNCQHACASGGLSAKTEACPLCQTDDDLEQEPSDQKKCENDCGDGRALAGISNEEPKNDKEDCNHSHQNAHYGELQANVGKSDTRWESGRLLLGNGFFHAGDPEHSSDASAHEKKEAAENEQQDGGAPAGRRDLPGGGIFGAVEITSGVG